MRNNYLKSPRFKVCARDASVCGLLEGGVSGGPGCLGAGVVWFPLDWHRLGSQAEACGWNAFCPSLRPSWDIPSLPVHGR